MNSVRVVADGGCDLSKDIAARYQISIVPVFVNFGQETVSSDQLTPTEFWGRVERSTVLPSTSGPSLGSFQHVFEQLVSEGHDVVCLTLPARYSGIFNTAWAAGQDFGERVRVFDSGSLSLGMGLQAIQAARDALAGQSADAVYGHLQSLRERTSVVFVLETLEWARRSGRLARLMPIIERMTRTLHVRPIIELVNGEFRFLGVARSTHGALRRLEEELRSRLPVEALAAAYTQAGEGALAFVSRAASVAGISPADILVTEAGPVFAAHAGPGAFGAGVIRS